MVVVGCVPKVHRFLHGEVAVSKKGFRWYYLSHTILFRVSNISLADFDLEMISTM